MGLMSAGLKAMVQRFYGMLVSMEVNNKLKERLEMRGQKSALTSEFRRHGGGVPQPPAQTALACPVLRVDALPEKGLRWRDIRQHGGNRCVRCK